MSGSTQGSRRTPSFLACFVTRKRSRSGRVARIHRCPCGAFVEDWVAGLASASWQAPSVPFPELSSQPDYEVRSAVVPGSGGVEVFYRTTYVSGGSFDVVDLIAVVSPSAGER